MYLLLVDMSSQLLTWHLLHMMSDLWNVEAFEVYCYRPQSHGRLMSPDAQICSATSTGCIGLEGILRGLVPNPCTAMSLECAQLQQHGRIVSA
jgi:hypothetical protein